MILAGGKGSRISKYLKNIPKPMIKIGGIPFLQHQINKFFKYPFINCFILSGFRGKIIEKKFHKKIINFVKINNIIEDYPLGTGGALRLLKNKIKNDFLLVNGDTFFDVPLDEIFYLKKLEKKLLTIFLTDNKNYKSNSQLSNLKINEKNIVEYDHKSNLMNGGIYLCKKKIINKISQNIFSFENEILKKLIQNKKVSGIYKKNYFIDIGIPKKLNEASKKLTKVLMKPAAFLDRDGVINHDYGYVHELNHFEFKKGVLDGLKELIKRKYYVFIVTNQAGIGKNIFKLDDFYNLQTKIKNNLSQKNIYFDDVQYCPFHPKAKIIKYRKISKYRKPNNGMIEHIKKNWIVDLKKSFFIGDKKTDMLAAKKSKIYFEYAQNDFLVQIKKIIKTI